MTAVRLNCFWEGEKRMTEDDKDERIAELEAEVERLRPPKPEVPLCNVCGLTCGLPESGDEDGAYGLIRAAVSGGFSSTAGNGHGALDDGETYIFSLCEFCLDWLFEQFKIPVYVDNYMTGDIPEPWRPAARRVAEDAWRRQKESTLADIACRASARSKIIP